VHGTSRLRVWKNVAYNIKGHAFYVESWRRDAKNSIRENLALDTRRSFSLLYTDQTPAAFWLSHPNNDLYGNRAAGSDSTGFWYDLAAATVTRGGLQLCNEGEPLGEFSNNEAHSNRDYGLRVFHSLISREYPCEPVVYDSTNEEDPFHENPIITNTFKGFLAWRNGKVGAIATQVGDVRFVGFTVVENVRAGIEFEVTDYVADNRVAVDDSLVVGQSAAASAAFRGESKAHGVVCPRSEFFTVKNTRFFNFDWTDAAALGDCSNCRRSWSSDSGARTYKTSNLTFVSVNKRIRHQYPYNGIFFDVDGSLTGWGPGSWATSYYPHLDQQHCMRQQDGTPYDGLICSA
jgi:hypothetical protein